MDASEMRISFMGSWFRPRSAHQCNSAFVGPGDGDPTARLDPAADIVPEADYEADLSTAGSTDTGKAAGKGSGR